jgi:V8-like Glu-specific endopeptidase
VSGFVEDFFSDNLRQITHSITLPAAKKGGISYAIDTKSGQSGAPVYLKDKTGIKLMGIHKGFSVEDKLNFGVMINSELIAVLKKWAV